MQLFEPLYESIIRKLITQKGATVQELHISVNKESPISLPNFYKVIGKLVAEQVLIKEHGRLFLHSRWVLGFLDLADELRKTYLTDGSSVEQLKEGESLFYESSTIQVLDGVWGDWMLSVNRIYGTEEKSYVYQARPYYALGMHETEMAFFTQVHKLSEVVFLTGNTHFLDKEGAERYRKLGIKALASDQLPFLKDGYCVTVVGDYVFEVIYSKEISDYFKIFFDTIKEIEDFNGELFQRIFEMRSTCKLSLRRDPIQAKSIKKVFEKAFVGYKE